MSGTLKVELIRTEIRSHLTRVVGRQLTLDDAEDVVAAGVIKSMNLLDLITRLEDAYGVEVSQRDVHAGHFRTIAAMAAFVSSRGVSS